MSPIVGSGIWVDVYKADDVGGKCLQKIPLIKKLLEKQIPRDYEHIIFSSLNE